MALNKLITRITTISELKSLFNEIVFNTTSKVTKITKTSVFSGISYGVAKLAQKAIKDVAVLESQIFPEFAAGQYLDNAANLWVSETRKTAVGSSTFVLVNATQGTVYRPGLNRFISTSGVEFDIVTEKIIDENGFGYVKVRSNSTGLFANVDAFTINSINPKPIGHINCTNEYQAIGGYDDEPDSLFRERILSAKNINSRMTLDYVTEVLRTFDSDILRVYNDGLDDNYAVQLAIVRVNGAEYTDTELMDLQNNLVPYLSLNDSISSFGVGVKLKNTNWLYINGETTGIDFRLEFVSGYNTDTVRKQIQIALTKYLDFRFIKVKKILWDDLLEVVKNVEGVKFVPVEHFNPRVDITIPTNYLPRIKVFRLRDLAGSIIFDANGRITPIFYENIV